MKFLVINGPNLNLTQFTEPGMEGQIDFNTLLDYIEAGCAQMDVQVDFFQSNHEGDLIDEIQSAAGRADGIILNPGGYAYYSVAILEALQVCGVPAVEVMLANPWIDNVTRVSAPYKRANRLFHPADSIIDCGGVKIGRGEKIAVMAGPCSIEGEEQALRIANGVKAGGASLFRGGAYKPRTSPYSFQGLETEGILDMVKAREATGMPIVSELMSEDRIPEFEEYVDVVQIGARNMQNFQLLKAVGKMHKPVLLKRGLCNTIEEWIMSAEYIMAGGNEQVILCERGIRTFEKYTRNTLDLSAVPIIHEKTHLPIIVDPSHATGKANLVEPMMIAAVAAGADGLEVEVHYDPRHAWSDGAQCLTPDAFAQAMAKCRQVAWAIGRDM